LGRQKLLGRFRPPPPVTTALRGIVTPTSFEIELSNILDGFGWMNAAFVQLTALRSAEIARAWAFAG
jgi:hypothetical protein